MTASQSKKHSDRRGLTAAIVLAAVTLLYVPGLIQHTIAVALFAAVGVLVVRKTNPQADVLEQLTAGTLSGLVLTTLMIYVLNMALGVGINRLTIIASLAAIAAVAVAIKKETF